MRAEQSEGGDIQEPGVSEEEEEVWQPEEASEAPKEQAKPAAKRWQPPVVSDEEVGTLIQPQK